MKPDAYYKNGENLNFVPSTHAEERALFVKAKAGDEVAKEKIIHDHLLLVANIARRLARNRIPEDDVISAANFALMKAYENFDSKFPNRFAAFLNLHVRGEIARLWRGMNIVDKGDFSDGEPVVSVPVAEDTAEDTSAEDHDHRTFLLKMLADSKSILDDRERSILGMIFSEEQLTQAEVARRLKITRERVRQIFDAALEKLKREMRKRMNEQGVNQ